VALEDASFDVVPGRMTGFVGANGAGKTTSMRIIMGVLAATTGEVRWEGHRITREDRQRFGYMPEERGLYPKQKVLDQLVFFGQLHGLSRSEAAGRAEALLDWLDRTERAKDRLDTLSLGNQQRVQIAAALIHAPVALVLDEPFSGLDPIAVDSMAAILRDEVARGVPVLFSSHQLELVERLCDDLVILTRGRVAAAGPAEDLRRSAGTLYRLTVGHGADVAWVGQVAGVEVKDLDGDTALLEITHPGAEQEVLTTAGSKGPVREFTPVLPPLSEIFREVIR
jgi:ABC-2 type transport system ATP-binding protein